MTADEEEEAQGLSPCVRACGIDRATGLCRGCRRTLDEIVSWPEKTAAERRAIMAGLRQRAPLIPWHSRRRF